MRVLFKILFGLLIAGCAVIIYVAVRLGNVH